MDRLMPTYILIHAIRLKANTDFVVPIENGFSTYTPARFRSNGMGLGADTVHRATARDHRGKKWLANVARLSTHRHHWIRYPPWAPRPPGTAHLGMRPRSRPRGDGGPTRRSATWGSWRPASPPSESPSANVSGGPKPKSADGGGRGAEAPQS